MTQLTKSINNQNNNNNLSRLKRFSNMILKEKNSKDFKNMSFNYTPDDSKISNNYTNKLISNEKLKLQKRFTSVENDLLSTSINNKNSKDFLSSSYDVALNKNNATAM